MSSDDTTRDQRPENAKRDASHTTVTDDAKVIMEFTIPADGFVLDAALQADPDRIVEFEQFVPTHQQLLPYLWVTPGGGDDEGFEEALREDPTVATLDRVERFEEGALYRIDWREPTSSVLEWLENHDATVLQAEGENGEWILKLRVDSRDSLGAFQEYCRDHDLRFDLIRLYELVDPKMGQFNITEKQRETLITALRMGYFEVPRSATLGEIANAMDISKRAASERLRRGHTNLVSNTLTIGQPTGVGLGTDT